MTTTKVNSVFVSIQNDSQKIWKLYNTGTLIILKF